MPSWSRSRSWQSVSVAATGRRPEFLMFRPLLGRRRPVDRRVSAVERAMSEYQYYEFVAIDRSLTEAEQDELRAV